MEIPDTVQFSSLNHVIEDAGAKHRPYLYFAFMNWQRAIRDDRYKLIEYCVDGKRSTQLFDLIADIEETRNLAGDERYAEILSGLRTLLSEERIRQNDGNTPYGFTDRQGKHFWGTYESVEEGSGS